MKSQITLLVWPCLLLTEKQHKINHLIVLNDSVSKSSQCSIQGFFVFHTIFKLDFITQIIYFIIHRCLYSLFILFLFSYTSFYETKHRNDVNLSLLIQFAKVQQDNERKKSIRVWALNM